MRVLRQRKPRRRLDSESYRALRKQVLQRDGWRCQSCGALTDLRPTICNPAADSVPIDCKTLLPCARDAIVSSTWGRNAPLHLFMMRNLKTRIPMLVLGVPSFF